MFLGRVTTLSAYRPVCTVQLRTNFLCFYKAEVENHTGSWGELENPLLDEPKFVLGTLHRLRSEDIK
jgi:hypothetical protein